MNIFFVFQRKVLRSRSETRKDFFVKNICLLVKGLRSFLKTKKQNKQQENVEDSCLLKAKHKIKGKQYHK